MKRIFAILLLASVAILFSACGKEKNCRCTVTSIDRYETVTAGEVIMNVDGDLKCESITVVGDQWTGRDGFTTSSNLVTCEEE